MLQLPVVSQQQGSTLTFPAVRNFTILPSLGWVHCVAPDFARSIWVPTVVHLLTAESDRRDVGGRKTPWLALSPTPGSVCLALIVCTLCSCILTIFNWRVLLALFEMPTWGLSCWNINLISVCVFMPVTCWCYFFTQDILKYLVFKYIKSHNYINLIKDWNCLV